jgi:hypothetical protein
MILLNRLAVAKTASRFNLNVLGSWCSPLTGDKNGAGDHAECERVIFRVRCHFSVCSRRMSSSLQLHPILRDDAARSGRQEQLQLDTQGAGQIILPLASSSPISPSFSTVEVPALMGAEPFRFAAG